MSCNSCQSKFSFFTREHGCPKCGFSFCSKCLKYKCEITKNNSEKVCGPCYNKMMPEKGNPSVSSSSFPSPGKSYKTLAPVDIEQKLNSLENPIKPPIVMYKHGHWDKLKAGLEPEDQAIVDRLKKLKEHDKKHSQVSTEDIRRRLALLKDEDPDYVPPTNIPQLDTRSDQEKTDDLIREYMETLELSKTDPAAEIEKKLNDLKGIDPSKSRSTPVDFDEYTVTKNLIDRALAEAALEKGENNDDDLEEMEVELSEIHSDDEDIQCATCEKTKNLVQCTGCPFDLYCGQCFSENHDEFELKKHRPVPVEPRRQIQN